MSFETYPKTYFKDKEFSGINVLSMSWVLEIKLNRSQLDQASLWLWSQEEVRGIQEKPGLKDDFFKPQKNNDVVEYDSKEHQQEKAWLKDERYLENSDTLFLNVFFDSLKEERRRQLIEDLQLFLGGVDLCQWKELRDLDYIDQYKKNVVASEFGDGIWVGPPWQEVPQYVKIPFLVDPGMAFGTGEHPTTQMCLESLQELSSFDRDDCFKTFLDLGCGTGILSLGVKKFFPHSSLVVSDLDPLCQSEFQKNFALNQIATSDIVQFWGADAHCSEILKKNYSFDCVVSNIYAEILADLSGSVAQLLNPGGFWVASGILKGPSSAKLLDSIPAVLSLEKEVRRQYKGEEWLCFVWKRI